MRRFQLLALLTTLFLSFSLSLQAEESVLEKEQKLAQFAFLNALYKQYGCDEEMPYLVGRRTAYIKTIYLRGLLVQLQSELKNLGVVINFTIPLCDGKER